MRASVPIGKVRARAYTIPTDKPEADGTIAWNSTTLIVVEVAGGNVVGLGLHLCRRFDHGADRGQAGRDHRRASTPWIRRRLGARCSVPCAISAARGSPRPRFPRSMPRCTI